MSTLLSSHLEQIATCALSISELPFPGPKAFTNAILSTPDITKLIRDTEVHERALYQLAPPETYLNPSTTGHGVVQAAKGRRATVYNSKPPTNRAVATVLGSDLYNRIQHQQRGEVDVELLLHGATKLANVYPVPGALDRIAKLQQRAQQLESNIAHYEARIAEQRTQLDRMHSSAAAPGPEDDSVTPMEDDVAKVQTTTTLTILPSKPPSALPEDDPAAVAGDIEQLEQRKKALEDRVSGMDKDLNALAR